MGGFVPRGTSDPHRGDWVDYLWLAVTEDDVGVAAATAKAGAWYAYNVDGFGPESYCEWDRVLFEHELTSAAWDFEVV